MTNLIEESERKLQKYFRRLLIAFSLAVALLAVRAVFYYGFNEYNLNSQPIGIAILIATIIVLAIAVRYVVLLGRLKSRIGANPQLKEALIDDELTKLHAVQSWRSAFIGAVATPFVFLLISTYHPFCDLLTVALTTGIVGSGAYLISYYWKNRS